MPDDKSRLVIIATFMWIALAATTILSTHRDVLALDRENSGYGVPAVESVIEPLQWGGSRDC